jgi:uncharacterized protein DUF5677
MLPMQHKKHGVGRRAAHAHPRYTYIVADSEKMEFGFPEFAATVFAEYGPALRLAHAHSGLANEIFAALPSHLKRDSAIIYMLVRMTTTGWVELLILVGNGAGLGAMKIARGMFESSLMAEYLRRVPEEIDDYVDYGPVLNYKRLKQYFPAELNATIKQDYERAAARFINEKGRLRKSWNKYPISYMAAKVGWKERYELDYSIAASIHHGNFEAMVSHISRKEALDVDSPPSLTWIKQALATGHVYLLQALDTLNELLKLGFDEKLRLAGEEFARVWRDPKESRQEV